MYRYYNIFTVMLIQRTPDSPGRILGFKICTCIKYASSFIPKLSDEDLSSRFQQLVFAQSNTNNK